jgi:aerobic carbon-monoxide dehydrogenase medium subunit
LLVLLKQKRIKPKYLVNIKGLSELEYIREDGDVLKLGALTTHRALETSSLVREKFPMLAEMEQEVGCIQTRNWGTIGGNLCQASPATDLSPSLIACKGSVKVVSGRGERLISLDDLFVGYQKTCLEADEILVEIQLPKAPPRTGGVYRKEVVRFADPPIASLAAVMELDEQMVVKNARIVLQAVGVIPLRAREAEKAIIGEEVSPNLLDRAAALAAGEAQPITDTYGSTEYKREMVAVLTKFAVKEAIRRASRASEVQ